MPPLTLPCLTIRSYPVIRPSLPVTAWARLNQYQRLSLYPSDNCLWCSSDCTYSTSAKGPAPTRPYGERGSRPKSSPSLETGTGTDRTTRTKESDSGSSYILTRACKPTAARATLVNAVLPIYLTTTIAFTHQPHAGSVAGTCNHVSYITRPTKRLRRRHCACRISNSRNLPFFSVGLRYYSKSSLPSDYTIYPFDNGIAGRRRDPRGTHE
ncbi:hypothetical protein L210DRAFT_2522918 [Boletus edulis BED1]|uniref:Uncharacterized protein n=1 Tax=Boletus edulis BED1 TaxID=1328754 RepID=A0AAD4BMZ1_BOLED|nr:hypothetical protein L210DRAFT_2522918 [Boletus edulis BED1]